MTVADFTTFGFCRDCGEIHSIPEGSARTHCLELMKHLEAEKRIDFDVPAESNDEHFSTDYLFGEARGQMFGVLECEDQSGETVILKAFSCQYNGVWEVNGWVPPLFDVAEFDRIVDPVDKKIKAIGSELRSCERLSEKYKKLSTERKLLSQQLMKDIHDLYQVHSFSGKSRKIYDAFCEDKGVPTGCGDCCAPKLLNYAAKKGLKPIGLAEFYWGRENRSQTRKHGEFYSCCEGKCQPILGFMLCGL